MVLPLFFRAYTYIYIIIRPTILYDYLCVALFFIMKIKQFSFGMLFVSLKDKRVCGGNK